MWQCFEAVTRELCVLKSHGELIKVMLLGPSLNLGIRISQEEPHVPHIAPRHTQD